jgi:retron-type reverse transcriptase
MQDTLNLWDYSGPYLGTAPLRSFSFENVFNAYLDCRKGKRNSAEQLRFEADLSRNLRDLYQDLQVGTYTPGQHKCFVIKEPKPREVWSSFFRDRVVHHLVYNATSSRFYRSFIHDTFSCIPGRGIHQGQKRLQKHILSATQSTTRVAHYASLDIENYFNTISHDYVFDLITRKLHAGEEWLRDLWSKFIFHDIRKNATKNSGEADMAMISPKKSLMNAPPGIGMAIGNLTNQFLSNVNCNPLDHFVKRRLGCKHYVRYVDDFVLLSNDRSELSEWIEKVDEFLHERQWQKLHYGKTTIGKADSGIDFVGAIVYPYHSWLRRSTQRKAFHRIHSWQQQVEQAAFHLDREEFDKRLYSKWLPALINTVNSYTGMARQVNGLQWAHSIVERAIEASNGHLQIGYRYRPNGHRFPIVTQVK